MHTEVKYEGPDAEQKALADLVAWFGARRYWKLKTLFLTTVPPPSLVDFEVLCALGGIGGYPVRVWYEHLYGKGVNYANSGNENA